MIVQSKRDQHLLIICTEHFQFCSLYHRRTVQCEERLTYRGTVIIVLDSYLACFCKSVLDVHLLGTSPDLYELVFRVISRTKDPVHESVMNQLDLLISSIDHVILVRNRLTIPHDIRNHREVSPGCAELSILHILPWNCLRELQHIDIKVSGSLREHKLHLADGITALLAHILVEFSPKRPPSLVTKTERHTAHFPVVRSQKDQLKITRLAAFVIEPHLDTSVSGS